MWNQLWNLRIHRRYRIILWRFANGILPPGTELGLSSDSGNTLCLLCSSAVETELHLLEHCDLVRLLWFRFRDINIGRLQSRSVDEFMEALIVGNRILYPSGDADLRRQVIAFAAIAMKRIWELRNAVLHDGVSMNIERICSKIERDVREEETRFQSELGDQALLVGSADMDTLGQWYWSPPPCGTLKFNVDARWVGGFASMAVLVRNSEGEVLGLWYDNYDCASSISAKLLAIEKAILVSYNFMGRSIQIESDCKVAVDTLLGISECSWRVLSIFESVKDVFSMVENVELLWCPEECNEAAHAATKWVAQVIKNGTGNLFHIPPVIENYVFQDTFSQFI